MPSPYNDQDEWTDTADVPDNSDLPSADDFNVPIETLLDRTRFLYNRNANIPSNDWMNAEPQERFLSLVDDVVISAAGGSSTNPAGWTSQGPFADSTWTEIAGTVVTYPNAIGVNDFIEVDAFFTDQSGLTSKVGYAIGFSVNGGAFALGDAVAGKNQPAWFIAESGTDFRTLHASYVGPVATALPIPANGLQICLFGIQKSGGSASVFLAQPYTIKVRHYRAKYTPRVQSRQLIAAAWDSWLGKWWAVSPAMNDTVCTSTDWGTSWATLTPGASGIRLQRIVVDASGNAVAIGNNFTVYQYTLSTNTWANEAIGSVMPVNSEVVWESSTGTWVAYTNSQTGGLMKLYTSTNRVAWTDQSSHLKSPLGGDTIHTVQPRIGVGGGRCVIACMISGVVSVSSCAATDFTTWTAAATLTPAITGTVVSDPVYISTGGTFGTWLLAIAGNGTSFGATEVWASVDGGTTWTRKVTLGGVTRAISIVQLAALDPMVGALTSDGYVFYNLDGGTTWKMGRQIGMPGATGRSLWTGDGGFLELDVGGPSDGAVASIRAGKSNAATVGT